MPNNIGAFGENFPYTNNHDLNLDWMIKTFETMREEIANGERSIEEVREQVVQMLEQLDVTIDEKVEQAIADAIASGEFTDIIASVANMNIFYCVNPNMTQQFIQNAINTYSAIKFRPGTYNVYIPEVNDCGYSIPSNRTIFFDNAIIKKVGNYTHDYDTVIKIEDVENVILYGNGTIDYNREFMQEETGEHGMCISIGNSEHITIEGLKCINAFGDGIYLNNNHYIYINNVYCDNNRRNGIAIIAGEHYRVLNSYFINSNGTSPEAGIAIETNYATDILKDILVENCVSSGNDAVLGNDVYVTIKSSNGSVTLNNITCEAPIPVSLIGDSNIVRIENCLFGLKNNNHIFNVDSPDNNEIHYNNCEIDGKGITSSGSFIRYTATTLHNLFIENCKIKNCTLSGRAVLALGGRSDLDRIIVDCTGFNFNIPTPLTLFASDIANAMIIWSINNSDLKEMPADSAYPFNNYYITANTRPGTTGKTKQKIKLYNTSNATCGLYAVNIYQMSGAGTSVNILPSSYIEMESYKSGWYVSHTEPTT